MKVRRNVASLPARSAKETWAVITKLVTGAGSVDAGQLEAAASIACSAMADEHTAAVPIVLKGGGSRLVVYTVHGAEAMELGQAVDSLSWNPTASDEWSMTIPCSDEDVGWMTNALKERAPRITVHDVNAEPGAEAEAGRKVADVEIDWPALETR